MEQIPQLLRLLPFLALAASLQLTLGYYDPAAQRWINRDPIGDPSFLVRAEPPSDREAGFNHHTFVGNNPATQWDAAGLAAGIPGKVFFVPCPPGFMGWCLCACGLKGLRPSPFCYGYRSAGHTYFVFDCNCIPWRQ